LRQAGLSGLSSCRRAEMPFSRTERHFSFPLNRVIEASASRDLIQRITTFKKPEYFFTLLSLLQYGCFTISYKDKET
jgi:hypothetical protein